MNLCDVKNNQTMEVSKIMCNPHLAQRLSDLGLIKGTLITPVFSSPLGDPVAYEFRGNIIAIRNKDAKNISVK